MATIEKQKRQKLTPGSIAELYGISLGKVLSWIRRGELRAVNVANRADGQPRFRIDPEDLRDFENRRACVPAKPAPRTRRKRQGGVTEYF
jgi:Helix-turn-helix domain